MLDQGNGHKWLYSPKGSAVLWVPKDRQDLVEPTTISWEGVGVPNTHFQAAFAYTGTASYSPYLAMTEALKFREWLGGEERILDYIHGLAINASKHMVRASGVSVPLWWRPQQTLQTCAFCVALKLSGSL